MEENEKVETRKVQPNTPTQSKESKTWMIITVVVLIALFAFVWIFMVEDISEIIDRDTTICIAESSVLYGTEWCGYCKKQKEVFGTNVDLLNYIDCDKDSASCINAEIKAYPTWIINSESYTGVKYEEELRRLTGC